MGKILVEFASPILEVWFYHLKNSTLTTLFEQQRSLTDCILLENVFTSVL